MNRLAWGITLLVACCLLSCRRDRGVAFLTDESPDRVMAMAGERGLGIWLFLRTDDELSHNLEAVFADPEVGELVNARFVPVSADGREGGRWSEVASRYGQDLFPAILLLDAQGRLIMDVADLGNLQATAKGDFPCRRPLLRKARLAADFLNLDDSLFFDKAHWQSLNQERLRLDGELFRRVVAARPLLEQRYGNDYRVLIDYTFSCACVRLISRPAGQEPFVHPYRREVYFRALDSLDIEYADRYRFYADVNIAYGLDRMDQASSLAEEAWKAGVIREDEYRQLVANFR